MPHTLPIKIAVCDNVPRDLALISELSASILHNENIPHSITEYETADALMNALEQGTQYQILLLDIIMDEGMDGITLAERLRERDDRTKIIFISCNRELALRGYEVCAQRYLAKPPEEEKLREALLYCCRGMQGRRELLIQTEGRLHRIPFAEIQYVEAYDRGTRFVLEEETFETRMKYSEVEAQLPKTDFILCHRGFIVNLAWTKSIRRYEFVLKNGHTVPIGKGRYAECNKKFLDYITD